MHPMFADWYRLADLKPDAGTLDKRWIAIGAVQQGASLAEWLDIVRLFVGRPHKEVVHAGRFIERFKAADPLFPLVKNALEVQVLAGVAVMNLLEEPSDTADAVALAIVCVDCRGKGAHGPIADVLVTAQKYLAEEALRIREANEPALNSVTSIPIPDDPFEDIADISLPAARSDWQVIDRHFATNQTWSNAFLNAVRAMYTSVAEMAQAMNSSLKKVTEPRDDFPVRALYEEINILWWLFGERSRDLDIALKDVGLPAACVVAAKELVDLTNLLPGPVAIRSILGKALSTTGKLPSAIKLQDAVNKSPRDWRERWVVELDAAAVLDLTPVLRAVARSTETDEPDAWVAAYNKGATVKSDLALAPLDLANQLYDEGLLVRAHRVRA
jgi:hypothetical protein